MCLSLVAPSFLGAGDAERRGRHEQVHAGAVGAGALVPEHGALGPADRTAGRGGEAEVLGRTALVLATPPAAVAVLHPERETLDALPVEPAGLVGPRRVVGQGDRRLDDAVLDVHARAVLAGDVQGEGYARADDGATTAVVGRGVGGDTALVLATAGGGEGDEHERHDLLDLLEHRSVLSKLCTGIGAGVQRLVVLIHISTDR